MLGFAACQSKNLHEYNFVKRGVPAVVLENGRYPVDAGRPNQYPMPVWYHKPSDEYHEDWDLSGTLYVLRIAWEIRRY